MPTKTYVKPKSRSRLYKYSKSKLDKRIYKIAQIASARTSKREINKQFEKHYHDGTGSSGVSSGGVLYDISQIPVGDNDISRSGDRITIKSINVRGSVSVADSGGNLVRVLLFQCIRTDSASSPSLGNEIIQSTGYAQPWAPYTPYAKDFAGYTWIPLVDKTLSVSDTGNQQQQFEFKVKPKDFKRKAKPYIQFEGGTLTGVGKIYIAMYSDSGAVSHPNVNFYSRIRFIDN